MPALGLVNGTSERLVMVLYTGAGVSNLSSDAADDPASDVRAHLLDEQGRPLGGGGAGIEPRPAAIVTRSLSAANIPWQVRFVAPEGAPISRLLAARRAYFVLALVAVVLMVTAAC